MYCLRDYHVIWNTPGKNSSDSMTTGNGDIGINVWTDKKGDLLFYLGKTDSLDENGRLLKVGRLRLHFENSPFRNLRNFRQELSLSECAIFINTDEIQMKIWVDANCPAVHIEAESSKSCAITAALEIWRDRPRDSVRGQARQTSGRQF